MTEGIGFPPEAGGDGFVLDGVLARGLKFNPQARDACQTPAVVGDSGTADHTGSMRHNDHIHSPRCSYTRPGRPPECRDAIAVPWAEDERKAIEKGEGVMPGENDVAVLDFIDQHDDTCDGTIERATLIPGESGPQVVSKGCGDVFLLTRETDAMRARISTLTRKKGQV